MTKREAKRYVCALMAIEAEHHDSNGSEWLSVDGDGKEFTMHEHDMLINALLELSDELARRGQRAVR